MRYTPDYSACSGIELYHRMKYDVKKFYENYKIYENIKYTVLYEHTLILHENMYFFKIM